MATTSDFKTGLVIELDGELFSILDYQHVKPGKGGAFLKTKLRNIKTGIPHDKSFRAGEKITKAYLEESKIEYLYRTDNLFHFMDETNYEELILTDNQVGNAVNYLKENMSVTALSYKGNMLSIELPIFAELEVAETEPGLRGDTVSGAKKTAHLETGARIQVPLFIDKGETVRVDTRNGEYVERVS